VVAISPVTMGALVGLAPANGNMKHYE